MLSHFDIFNFKQKDQETKIKHYPLQVQTLHPLSKRCK